MATERKLPAVGEEIHLPGPSAQPLMTAVGTMIALIGLTIETPVVFIIGATILVVTLYAWIRDAIAEFKALPDHHGDHGHDDAHAHADDTLAAAPDLGKH